jgi:hypothetical protein
VSSPCAQHSVAAIIPYLYILHFTGKGTKLQEEKLKKVAFLLREVWTIRALIGEVRERSSNFAEKFGK